MLYITHQDLEAVMVLRFRDLIIKLSAHTHIYIEMWTLSLYTVGQMVPTTLVTIAIIVAYSQACYGRVW